MRILHATSVGYIQPVNNNSNSTLLHHNNTSLATDESNLTTSDFIENSSSESLQTSSENYTADLANLNGNCDKIQRHQQQQQNHQYRYYHNQNQIQNAQKLIYDLIDSDDNVNLTITTNRNNLSAKYTRNIQNNQIQNQNQNRNINIQINGNANNETSINPQAKVTTEKTLNNNSNRINNIKNKATINLNDNGNTEDNVEICNGNSRKLEFDKNLPKESDSVLEGVEIRSSESNLNSIHTSEQEEEDEDEDEEEEEQNDNKIETQNNIEKNISVKNRNLICNNYQQSEHQNINTIINRVSNTSTTNSSNTINFDKTQENRNPVKIEIKIGGGDNVTNPKEPSTKLIQPKENLSPVELKENLDKLDCKRNLQTLKSNSEYIDCQQLNETKSQQLECKYIRSDRNSILERNFHPGSGERNLSSYSSTCSSESSPDDSLMEDEDQYSPSQSSCASLNSPSELSNYPRGIINPNYPGFQHLAHTLSEHFVNQQQSSDADDSDLSEFEVELSVDSIDDGFTSFHTFNNNNNNNNNNNTNIIKNSNNNNNNDTRIQNNIENEIISKHRKLSSNSSTEEINFNSQTQTKENSDEMNEMKNIKIPEIRISEGTDEFSLNEEKTNEKDTNLEKCNSEENKMEIVNLSNSKSDDIKTNSINNKTEETIKCDENLMKICDAENISCDLDTYLKKYETVTDVKAKQMENNLDINDGQLDEKNVVERNNDEDDDGRNCPTPDILIKNDKIRLRRQKSSENRPDLLRNVSPKPEERYLVENDDINRKVENNFDEEKKCRIAVPDNIPLENQRTEKEDISYSITPVDIVGDFGQEVEREFGLLVSGYNTTLLCRDCSPLTNPEHEKKLAMQKMADAILSDGQEELSLSRGSGNICNRSLISCSQKIKNSTCDLVQKSLPSSSKLLLSADEKQKRQNQLKKQQEFKEGTAKVKQHPHENLNTPAQSLMFTTKNRITNINQSGSVSSAEKHIPTAIVKPKYQKSSYDDRQLPPIGFGYSIESDLKSIWCSSSSHTTPNGSGSDSNISNNRSRKILSQSGGSQNDRNHPRHTKKFISRGNSSSQSRAGGEKLTSSRRCDGRDNEVNVSNSSVIAIVTPRKKDKMEIGNDGKKCNNKTDTSEKNNNNNNCVVNGNNNNNVSDIKRHDTLNSTKDKKDFTTTASFDVYNIETALPVIDLEAIENHLKKAKEEERKRRNDREEIRRRLAMGAEDDYFSKIVNADRPGRKPSLQSRLQSGMNLQICFMNEASSDTESPSSDSETCPKLSKSITTKPSTIPSRYSSSSLNSAHPYNSRPLSVNISSNNNNKKSTQNRPSSLTLGPPIPEDADESDFFTKQARLQIEARMALAQAKDMAHMQMEIERQKQKQSPITEVIRNSLEKVGVPFPPEKRRVSRQMLTDMNIAQLQIIVNELHTQIERLNERLVQYLMERDDLHMGQDSMLVDIEDLTRYLGAKEQSRVDEKVNHNNPTTTITTSATVTNCSNTHILSSSSLKSEKQQQKSNLTSSMPQAQSKFQRIANLVKK